MYGIFSYIWVIFKANVGKYSIHGASGIHWEKKNCLRKPISLFSGVAVYLIRLTKQDG
jgi:hypothetical protein